MRSRRSVSIEGLLNKRCTVQRSTLSWSASHWLVRPWRRNSSRIRLPMCICIVIAVCALGYRFPIRIPTTADKKRRRAISSPVCGRGKLPSGIDKMLACRRAFAHLSFLNDLFEVFHVSYWSEQIANAMLLIVYLLQYNSFLCHNVHYNLIAKLRFIFESAKNNLQM